MPRHPDWPLRLARFLDRWQGRPFAWGRADCALFAADWVREATGVDHAARYRGRYRTARGARRALKRFGPGDLAATVSAALGPPLDNPLLAQRGDLVMVQPQPGEPRDLALGVCAGETLACLAPNGLVRLPIMRAIRAWRV